MPAKRVLLDVRSLEAALTRLDAVDRLPEELVVPDPAAGATPPSAVAVHPAVLAALGVLLLPAVPRVQLRAGTGYRRRLTLLAVAEGLGVLLARDVDPADVARPLELAVFPDSELAAQVAGCLPPLPHAEARSGGLRAVDPALLLAAVARGAGGLLRRVGGWDDEGDYAVEALSTTYAASFEVTVTARNLVARLLWVHADGGWWHLAPVAGFEGGAALDVTPVTAGDLLAALVPLLAGALVRAPLRAAR